MSLPASWGPEKPSIVNIACQISPTSPLPLKKVALSARTSKGYEFASRNSSIFKKWLFSNKPILRTGFTYRLPPPRHGPDIGEVFHEYTVLFAEPFVQGYALSSLTEISVSLRCDARPDRFSERLEAVCEDEYIEIDQNFMANSVFPKTRCAYHPIPFIPI